MHVYFHFTLHVHAYRQQANNLVEEYMFLLLKTLGNTERKILIIMNLTNFTSRAIRNKCST